VRLIGTLGTVGWAERSEIPRRPTINLRGLGLSRLRPLLVAQWSRPDYRGTNADAEPTVVEIFKLDALLAPDELHGPHSCASRLCFALFELVNSTLTQTDLLAELALAPASTARASRTLVANACRSSRQRSLRSRICAGRWIVTDRTRFPEMAPAVARRGFFKSLSGDQG